MKIELVNKNDKSVLNELLKLYLHEISLSFPNVDYNYDLDKYFNGNYAYFIQYECKNIGFILIDDNKDKNYEISEIYVIDDYKKKGIAKKALYMIFSLYKGNWVIKAVPNSKGAETFWDKVINEYTNNNYKKLNTGKYQRAEYYFDNTSNL